MAGPVLLCEVWQLKMKFYRTWCYRLQCLHINMSNIIHQPLVARPFFQQYVQCIELDIYVVVFCHVWQKINNCWLLYALSMWIPSLLLFCFSWHSMHFEEHMLDVNYIHFAGADFWSIVQIKVNEFRSRQLYTHTHTIDVVLFDWQKVAQSRNDWRCETITRKRIETCNLIHFATICRKVWMILSIISGWINFSREFCDTSSNNYNHQESNGMVLKYPIPTAN